MRSLIKTIILLFFTLLISPFLLIYLIFYRILKFDDGFIFCSQLLSLIPGQIGRYSRRAFYSIVFDKCGKDVIIDFGTVFSRNKVELGSNVYIGGGCTIGSVKIGDGTLIGSNIDILSGRHQHKFDSNLTAKTSSSADYKKISVGKNAWIGNRSIIMADIGDYSIIGAGSVVVKPIPHNKIAVGNPAKIIKER